MRHPLTERRGRGLVLTDAGREYFRSVRTAFAVLRGATAQFRDGKRSTHVRLGVIPLFARAWLFRNIGDFLCLNPDVDLNVSYAHHRNYVSDSADLSIRFGEGQWTGYTSYPILSGVTAPFCSPAFLALHPGLASESNLSPSGDLLIHDQDRDGWRSWFLRDGDDVGASGGLLVEDGNLALQAALEGLGIALLRPALVGRFVDEGVLTRLSVAEWADGRDYYLCHLSEQPLSDAEDRLLSWMLARCRPRA